MTASQNSDAHSIKTSWLVITYDCNNRCEWCYTSPAGFPKTYMRPDLAQQCLELIASLGIKGCTIIGGEPTIHPQMIDIVTASRNFGMSTAVVTNGRRLSYLPFAKQLKETGLNRVSISIEGPEEVHDSITARPGSFKQTMQGITNSLEVGLHTVVLSTICNANLGALKELIDILAQHAVPHIALNTELPNANSPKDMGVPIDPSTLVRAIIELDEYVGNRMKFEVHTHFPLCVFPKKDYERLKALGRLKTGCHVFHGAGLIIDPEGKILPCTHWTNVYSGSVVQNGGVINPEEFVNLWNGGEPEKVREQLWVYPSENCVGCVHWGQCVGGCPLLRLTTPAHIVAPGIRD